MNLIKVSASSFNKYALRSLLSSRTLHLSSPAATDKTYYEILRVPPSASQSEIKDAYFKLSKVYHPDVAQDENSLKMFRSITEAYDVLGSVKSRLQYDRESGIPTVEKDGTVRTFGSRERNEFGALAPDYDRILARKSVQEAWEDLQYKDRRTEVQAAKNRFYVEEDNFIWSKYDRQLIHFGMVILTITWTLKYIDYKYFETYLDPPVNGKKKHG